MTCSAFTKQCASGECLACKDKLTDFAPAPDSKDHLIKYCQWQNQDKVEKVEITSSVGEAFEQLQQQLCPFLIHVYIKRKQAEHMIMLKEDVDGKTVLLQVDFSENASLQSQNEIQSCHWSHRQATVFTAYAWITDSVSESIVVVSDDLQHNKFSVYE
jgi:hypothetical protein